MRFYSFNNFGNNFGNSPGNNSGDGFAGLRFWLTVFLVTWGLSALGLGWLVNSLFLLLGLSMLIPAIAFVALQWWVRRSIVTSSCPVCSYEFTAARNAQIQCPSCGEALQVEQQRFVRLTPPGTIDVEVQAVD